MAYILHKFNLYHLASRVCQLPMPGAIIDYGAVLTLIRELEDEEAGQTRKFGHLQNLPSYHQAHTYILSIYTGHLFVILYRSCMHCGGALSEVDRRHSIRRYVLYATKVLESHDALCRREALRPYLWYAESLSTFHALLAAALLIYVASSPAMRQELSVSSIMSLLESCLHNFQALSHRSDVYLRGQQLLEKVFARNSSMSPEHHRSDSFSVSQGYTSSPATTEAVHLGHPVPDTSSQVASHGHDNMTDVLRCDGATLRVCSWEPTDRARTWTSSAFYPMCRTRTCFPRWRFLGITGCRTKASWCLPGRALNSSI